MQLPSLFDDQAAGLRGKAIALYALLIAANLGAWGWAIADFRGDVVLLGTALLAYYRLNSPQDQRVRGSRRLQW